MANCVKINYLTSTAANVALLAIVLKTTGLKPKVPVAVYACPHCRTWHLTSKKVGGAWQKWTWDAGRIHPKRLERGDDPASGAQRDKPVDARVPGGLGVQRA